MNPMQIQSDAQRCRTTLDAVIGASVEPSDHMTAVALADSLNTSARWLLRSTVENARNEGATWAQIGAILGVTRQAAQSRFGTVERVEEDQPTD